MPNRPITPLFSFVLAGLVVSGCTTGSSQETDSEPAAAGVSQGAERGESGEQQSMNSLTPEESDEGFVLLFDGQSLDAWRGFDRDDAPGAWTAAGGTLAFVPGGDGGDLITRETFTDFDLRLEWKIERGGNSGIFFGIVEGPRRTYHSGPEMQILDDGLQSDAGAGYNLWSN